MIRSISWLNISLQDLSGFCKDQTSKLNRGRTGTSMPASLRMALISAIPLQDYTGLDSLSWWEGGSLGGFYQNFPTVIAPTNRYSLWVTLPQCQSQWDIWGPGKYSPCDFIDHWTHSWARASLTGPCRPPLLTQPMMMFLVIGYLCQLGPCLQKSLECWSKSLTPVSSHSRLPQKNWRNHYVLQGSWYWDLAMA